jgi:aspartokinase-like uncharacterized kinase
VIGPVVIKVGGSLFDWSGLPRSLASILDDRWAAGQTPVLLAGGGAAADFVRDLDHTFALGELAAHRLALRALDLTAHALAALLPGLDVVTEFAALAPVWQRARVPVLAPHRFLNEHDCIARDPLPCSWDVTSDTIAARVAVALGARELVLLKSTPLPPATDRSKAARLGLVDGLFPDVCRELERVCYLDVRAATCTPRFLAR